jgi:hypothetical protein
VEVREVGAKRTVYTIGLVLSVVAFAITAGWVLPHLGFFLPVAVGAAMMAFGAVTFAYLLLTGPYVLRLDEQGIHDRSGVFQAGRVGWDEIEKILVVKAAGRDQVGLLLTDAARARRSSLVQELMKGLRADVGAHVVMAPEAIGPGGAAEHVALLERYRSEARATTSERRG